MYKIKVQCANMNIEEPNIKCLIDFDWWHHDSNKLNIFNE